jgi:hypothetical protein
MLTDASDTEPATERARHGHNGRDLPIKRLTAGVPELDGKGCAPSATRTRDLLLRRHNRLSAVQTSEDPRHQRAKQPQAVAV